MYVDFLVFCCARDIFNGARNNFQKNARDIEKMPMTNLKNAMSRAYKNVTGKKINTATRWSKLFITYEYVAKIFWTYQHKKYIMVWLRMRVPC